MSIDSPQGDGSTQPDDDGCIACPSCSAVFHPGISPHERRVRAELIEAKAERDDYGARIDAIIDMLDPYTDSKGREDHRLRRVLERLRRNEDDSVCLIHDLRTQIEAFVASTGGPALPDGWTGPERDEPREDELSVGCSTYFTAGRTAAVDVFDDGSCITCEAQASEVHAVLAYHLAQRTAQAAPTPEGEPSR